MTHAWILFVAYALATYRATRLIVEDTITSWMRDLFRRRGYKTLVKTDYMGSVVESSVVTRPGVGRLFAWLFQLVSCHWCASLWTGAVVALLAHFEGSWFQFVAFAASFSSVSGFLSSIEKRL